MDFTRLEFYRRRINLSQKTIAFSLGLPLTTYQEFESGALEISKPVEDAFFNLLARFPGGRDFSIPTIKAIEKYKNDYFQSQHEYPKGWHQIPAPWLSSKFKLVDLSPHYGTTSP